MTKPISIAEQTQFANIVTRVAVEHNGKYLLVQEAKPHVYGKWAFPGGKVDVGEMLADSAVREIKEETGLDIKLSGIIGIQHALWDERPGFTLEIDFIATTENPPEHFEPSDEILSIDWISLEDLRAMGDDSYRNPGQPAFVRMLESGKVLPMSSLESVRAFPPVMLK